MLVLSRRLDEVVDITLEDGRVIEVAVVLIRSDKIRLSITAPETVTINRREITKRIQFDALNRKLADRYGPKPPPTTTNEKGATDAPPAAE